MNESEALSRMVPPGAHRRGKYLEGVVQIHVTRACDRACYNCTQNSQLAGRVEFMSIEHFEAAAASLEGYFGVVGVFGGNPALSPHFAGYCEVLRRRFPKRQRGLWCNDLRTEANGRAARETFDPAHSNLNVHMSRDAFERFRRWWPEAHPVGLDRDSRHSPTLVSMRDVLLPDCYECSGVGKQDIPGMGVVDCPGCVGRGYPPGKVYDEPLAWELISKCDINQHWSAMVGVFRGELRAWFCEVAGAQSILHQDDPSYPDTGLDPTDIWATSGDRPVYKWWQLGMDRFANQVRKHCHSCGVPLRGRGELACAPDGAEQVSAEHQDQARPKRVGRRVELVTTRAQLGSVSRTTDYLGNASR